MVVRCLNFAAKIVFFFETCKLFGLYSENLFDILDYIPKIRSKIWISTINKDFCGLSVAVRFLFFSIRFCRRNTEPLPKECLKTSCFRKGDNFFRNQVNLFRTQS